MYLEAPGIALGTRFSGTDSPVRTRFERFVRGLFRWRGADGRFRSFLITSKEDHLLSHIVSIQTEVRDPVAIRSACDRLRLPEPVFGEVKLFSSSATGWAVRLPEWRYPLVADVHTGKLAYDNYNGRWGAQRELDRFLQGYAVEVVRIEARKQGHSVVEQPLTDGSIKLTVSVGGAA